MCTRAELIEEGAKVGQIFMWLLYLCIKPETSEINVTKVFPCQSRVSRVSHGNLGQPDHYWAVLKIYFFLGPPSILRSSACFLRLSVLVVLFVVWSCQPTHSTRNLLLYFTLQKVNW